MAHLSDSQPQRDAEAPVLEALSRQFGVAVRPSVRIELDASHVIVDGAAEDESVLVEVFAHVGRLKGGQRHKISTDALKLLALSESRPKARLILAFVDQAAADSVSGWKREVLEKNGIERMVVELGDQQRELLRGVQADQREGMRGDEAD